MADRNTQCRKPHGEDGIKTVNSMNEHHEPISNFAFECINVNENDDILDIGCGGGANIAKFLKLTNGRVWGLDYSDVSVSESAKNNQEAVDNGTCQIVQADVMNMPLDDGQFDIVSAFETVYFWPELNQSFSEVHRILKENGQFMIALGTDGNHPQDKVWLEEVEGMNVYTKEELREYLKNAGFKNVNTFQPIDDGSDNKHILVVIAEK